MLESTYTNLGPTGTDVYVKQSVTVNLRSVSDLESRSKTLMGLHDHIADLKAQYDANKTLTFPGCMCLQSPMFVLGGIPLILSQGRMRPPSCRLTSERWKLSKILSLASLAPSPKIRPHMFDLDILSLLPRPSQVLQGSDGAKQVEEVISLDPALPNHMGINSNPFLWPRIPVLISWGISVLGEDNLETREEGCQKSS